MTFDHPFYFLRHGETEWNKTKRIQGQMNSALNETGRAQAKRAGEILRDAPIERIVSSPLDRVRDTAAEVAKFHDVPITYDDGLMECHLGEWQGEPWGGHVMKYWTAEADPPGGETFHQFAERVWRAMARAVALGPNTLIVAHGGLWRAAHEYTQIRPALPMMPNALPLHVTPDGENWRHEILDKDRKL